MRDEISTDFCVTPNARIIGRISERSRQIDVLIEHRHKTDNSCRVIIDAKIQTRKIDIKEVEAFKGLMEDVGARQGYLICANGWTKSAEKRAQESISIHLIPLDQLKHFDPRKWPKCQHPSCANGLVFWDGFPGFDVTLYNLATQKNIVQTYVHYVGKCDRCKKFHIQCVTCNKLFSLYVDESKRRCKCNMPWFWSVTIEKDVEGISSAELHADMPKGRRTVSRRSM